MTASTKRRRAYRKSPASALLRSYGATIREVSEISGVERSEISRVLHGDRKMAPEILDAIAELLGDDAAGEIVSAIPRRRKPASAPKPKPVPVVETVEEPSLFDRIRAWIFPEEASA